MPWKSLPKFSGAENAAQLSSLSAAQKSPTPSGAVSCSSGSSGTCSLLLLRASASSASSRARQKHSKGSSKAAVMQRREEESWDLCAESGVEEGEEPVEAVDVDVVALECVGHNVEVEARGLHKR
eukprot:1994856-Rhodomonas_salina.1